jgi:phospholipase/carboxylesterase
MNEQISAIKINTTLNPSASVIWLHGLGADGNDFVDIIPKLNLPSELGIRFIFPHAPVRPITLNGGYKMRAWFNVFALDDKAPLDEDGILESQKIIDQLILQEINSGIASDRIVLAGFSQGAAMSLFCGLCNTHKLAGIISLSGFLPFITGFTDRLNSANLNIPILMLHGTLDNIVPINWAEASFAKLNKLGCLVDWHTYQAQHNVCSDDISTISKWLQNTLQK